MPVYGGEISQIAHRINKDIERLRRDILSESFQSLSEGARRQIMVRMHACIGEINKPFRIGVLTAIPAEFAAVRTMLDEVKEYPVPGDPNGYCVGTVPVTSCGFRAKHLVVCAQLIKTGNNSAASCATNLLRSFPNVKDILMVGIAGGIPHPTNPGKHVRLGDVVVSKDRGVVQYDMTRMHRGVADLIDTSSPPSARVLNQVNFLEAMRLTGRRPWEDHIFRARTQESSSRPPHTADVLHDSRDPNRVIKHPPDPGRRKGQPKIHYGLIGSANILLRNPELRNQLRDRFGVLAIEMEGSGVADGTWTHGAHYMLIRGISDYCDEHKNKLWQAYAAIAAAAYARALLETLIPE